MYLNIPTNWDNEIILKIAKINEDSNYPNKIKQIYGSTLTSIGSGRIDTPDVNLNLVKNHINKIKNLGILFNFLINAPSLGGIEHDKKHRQSIITNLGWISDLGVDMITVSIPFLGELANFYFPHLKVKLSTILDIRTVQHIAHVENLGSKIHSITLSRFINRDFELLKDIKRNAAFEIELLANSICLLNCPFQKYHGDLVGWYSKKEKLWDEPFIDYRPLSCDEIRLNNIEEFIKSPWIRPEDLDIYSSIGIDSIKIAGRTFPTKRLLLIIEAYARGVYQHNLWDLIAPHIPVYIDNNSLSDFLEHFVKNEFICNTKCDKCNYCYNVAQKSVVFKSELNDYLKDLKLRLKARIDHSIDISPFLKHSI